MDSMETSPAVPLRMGPIGGRDDAASFTPIKALPPPGRPPSLGLSPVRKAPPPPEPALELVPDAVAVPDQSPDAVAFTDAVTEAVPSAPNVVPPAPLGQIVPIKVLMKRRLQMGKSKSVQVKKQVRFSRTAGGADAGGSNTFRKVPFIFPADQTPQRWVPRRTTGGGGSGGWRTWNWTPSRPRPRPCDVPCLQFTLLVRTRDLTSDIYL